MHRSTSFKKLNTNAGTNICHGRSTARIRKNTLRELQYVSIVTNTQNTFVFQDLQIKSFSSHCNAYTNILNQCEGLRGRHTKHTCVSKVVYKSDQRKMCTSLEKQWRGIMLRLWSCVSLNNRIESPFRHLS